MPKVIITLVSKGKLTNIRAILNTKAKVSIISFNIALRFKILITYYIKIAL
jgi:ribosomal protein L30E